MPFITLIQKDAPNSLLIGTDQKPALGFSLTVKLSAKQETMLLGENLQGSNTAGDPQESDSRVVYLLTAVKILARYQKLIKAIAGDGCRKAWLCLLLQLLTLNWEWLMPWYKLRLTTVLH